MLCYQHNTDDLVGGSDVQQQGLRLSWSHEDWWRAEVALEGLKGFLGLGGPFHGARFLEQLEERQCRGATPDRV